VCYLRHHQLAASSHLNWSHTKKFLIYYGCHDTAPQALLSEQADSLASASPAPLPPAFGASRRGATAPPAPGPTDVAGLGAVHRALEPYRPLLAAAVGLDRGHSFAEEVREPYGRAAGDAAAAGP
jgi:hypothetical protein